MTLKISTPTADHGNPLYYRRLYDVGPNREVGGKFVGEFYYPPKSGHGIYKLTEPRNMLAQIRVWRWMREAYQRRCDELTEDQRRRPGAFSDMILKSELCGRLFSDVPVTSNKVGRLLRMVVPYEVNFQRNPTPGTEYRNLMYWRWVHYLEIAYGLEHVMATWLPDAWSDVKTPEDWRDEMEVLMGQTPEEQLQYVRDMHKVLR